MLGDRDGLQRGCHKSDNKVENLKSIFEADVSLNEILVISRNIESYQANLALTMVALNHQFF